MHTSRIAASAVPAAVLGNGSLLATVSGQGRVEGLWWPHPDREQQLGELRLGIEIGGVSRWLDEEPFAWTQSYADRSTISSTRQSRRSFAVSRVRRAARESLSATAQPKGWRSRRVLTWSSAQPE